MRKGISLGKWKNTQEENVHILLGVRGRGRIIGGDKKAVEAEKIRVAGSGRSYYLP